jgi:Heterokaryon incompatibility protein (HET)
MMPATHHCQMLLLIVLMFPPSILHAAMTAGCVETSADKPANRNSRGEISVRHYPVSRLDSVRSCIEGKLEPFRSSLAAKTVLYVAKSSISGVPSESHADNQGQEAAVQYEALSYCWGDPRATHFVWRNDLQMPVAENLCFALSNLRVAKNHRVH